MSVSPLLVLPVNMQTKIAIEGDCWTWTGAKNPKGYGSMSDGTGRSALAHRMSYTLVVGEIPRGLEIDHLCENTSCVNPKHLEAVTGEEHRRRVGHENLRPIYSAASLAAYIPASKPAPLPEWLANIITSRAAMSAEELAEDQRRRHRLHLATGTRCQCDRQEVAA